ncbi:thiopurine S-methyltransferase-like [Hyalella azteca]|uniref:Thiopurine S-methyltransferase-like n=1 Tax=Hyalella azteca TaxID=294128 RepID=A0A8B7PMP8_HYAAZ|nr:thiopurine S-methyltransferase-like [Hyalella azteca]
MASVANYRTMDFWDNRWATGKTEWHVSDFHPCLVKYAGEVLQGRDKRVLVPLCGKTLDLLWLYKSGHRVVGVEGVEKIVQEFGEEHKLDFRLTKTAYGKTYQVTSFCYIQSITKWITTLDKPLNGATFFCHASCRVGSPGCRQVGTLPPPTPPATDLHTPLATTTYTTERDFIRSSMATASSPEVPHRFKENALDGYFAFITTNMVDYRRSNWADKLPAD